MHGCTVAAGAPHWRDYGGGLRMYVEAARPTALPNPSRIAEVTARVRSLDRRVRSWLDSPDLPQSYVSALGLDGDAVSPDDDLAELDRFGKVGDESQRSAIKRLIRELRSARASAQRLSALLEAVVSPAPRREPDGPRARMARLLFRLACLILPNGEKLTVAPGLRVRVVLPVGLRTPEF